LRKKEEQLMSIESAKIYIEGVKTEESDFPAEPICAVKTELSEDRLYTGAGGSSQAGEVTVGAIIVIIFLTLCGLITSPTSYNINENAEFRSVSHNIDENVEAR